MTDTIEQLTDNELHCWIRYRHRVEVQKMAPAVFENGRHERRLEDCLAEARVRWG